MRIITVVFDYEGSDAFERMLAVYAHSVREHMPTASFEVVRISAPVNDRSRNIGLVSNTAKLHEWVRVLRAAKARDEIVFTDCDMLAIGDLGDAFENEFDVAFTRRLEAYPLNGGVVFVRPTSAAVAFFELWLQWNNRFMQSRVAHQPWYQRYGGINQASLGKILTECEYDADVIDLPCEIYNAVDTDWKHVTEETRMVHLKGDLRRAIFSSDIERTKFPEHVKVLARRWRDAERSAVGV